MSESKERLKWIDIAKSLAMICVIVGHKSENSVLNGIIYSFHMPAFFMLSGLTIDACTNWMELKFRCKKTVKKFLPLYLTVFAAQSLIEALKRWDAGFFSNRMMTLMWSSGASVEIGRGIEPIGMIWFLVVLVESKILYWLIKQVFGRSFNCSIFITSSIGMFLGSLGIWLPLSLDVAFLAVFFIAVGNEMKHIIINRPPRLKFVIPVGLIWIATIGLEFILVHKQFNMAHRQYPLGWVFVLTAVCGTVVLICFSIVIGERNNHLSNVLAYMGRNTLIILVVHSFDAVYAQLIGKTFPQVLAIVLIIVIDFFVACLLAKMLHQ